MNPKMLCVKCKKRLAVVYVTRMENGESKNEGYCLHCARELGLAPVDDMLNKMGITEEDFDRMSQDAAEMLEDGDFSEGGVQGLNLLGQLMGKESGEAPQAPEKSGEEGKKSDRKTGRKFLDAYCIDLTARARKGELDPVIGREE